MGGWGLPGPSQQRGRNLEGSAKGCLYVVHSHGTIFVSTSLAFSETKRLLQTLFQRSRERRQHREHARPPSPAALARGVLSGIENDLNDVRASITSTEQAIAQRVGGNKLLAHWQNLLDTMRRSERDLLEIKHQWEQRTVD
jgi:hypothetical protein